MSPTAQTLGRVVSSTGGCAGSTCVNIGRCRTSRRCRCWSPRSPVPCCPPAPGRRGVRVRHLRCGRLAADRLPPSEEARGVRAAHLRAARHVGLLPGRVVTGRRTTAFAEGCRQGSGEGPDWFGGSPAGADREWARRAVASRRGLHKASAERSSSWAKGEARGHSSLHAHIRINAEAPSNVPWERLNRDFPDARVSGAR